MTTGGLTSSDKVTITVNTGGDEEIDDIFDPVVFDDDTDAGTVEISNESDSEGEDSDGQNGANPLGDDGDTEETTQDQIDETGDG